MAADMAKLHVRDAARGIMRTFAFQVFDDLSGFYSFFKKKKEQETEDPNDKNNVNNYTPAADYNVAYTYCPYKNIIDKCLNINYDENKEHTCIIERVSKP